ncbi:MAG: hypothetical protein AABW47_00175 [Nanoarchaeota archaeon]
MEKDESQILLNNIKNFIKSAEIIYNLNDFTSSAILYFKALFSVLDLIILKEDGKIPKDHSERFRMLENKHIELYRILDNLYPLYRETYSFIINNKDCIRIKENVERIIKEQKIFENY